MAGRASNGESTINKGADGRWHGYVTVGFTLDGKLDRRHVTGKTRAVVVEKVRELERKRDSGTVGETSTPTVTEWLEHWLTTIAPRRVRQRTLESYESAVRKHLIPDSDGTASTGCAPSTSTSSTPRSSTPATPPPLCSAITASCPERSPSPCNGATSRATWPGSSTHQLRSRATSPPPSISGRPAPS